MTSSQLTEDAVREIEARANAASEGPWEFVEPDGIAVAVLPVFTERMLVELPADIAESLTDEQKVQVKRDYLFIAYARTDIPTLIRDWRELGRLYQTTRTALAESSTERERQLDVENTALREQLAYSESEIRSVLDVLGADVVHAHPEGGKEDIYGSLAITVIKLQKERDELRGKQR